MIGLALIVLPVLAAAAAIVWPSARTRPWLLPITGAAHAALSWRALAGASSPGPGRWLALDAVALAVSPMVSILFLICAAYSVTYLRIRSERDNRIFVAALLALLGFLTLALQAQNLGLLWVAVEAATLTVVPLLHFNGTARAFEATWKYLLVGGTGIALSLLGTFCLGYASLLTSGSGDLAFSALAAQGPALSKPWLITAWVLLLAGYGTKMGLAPMHTWKPDAYGEAPGVVGAMLAGGVTTMAFVALLRVRGVMNAAGEGAMTERTLFAMGLFSMFVAAFFLLAARDFKRILAYSSVEHMGILSVGAAMGGAGLWAALFHVWGNGLTKGALFLAAGNLRRSAGARTVDEVAGMAWRSPGSSRLLVAGLLAITACPPFGPFFSEMRILRSAFDGSHLVVAAIFLLCLFPAFVGLTRLVFTIVDGRPRTVTRSPADRFRETSGVLLPPLLCLVASLWIGLALPASLRQTWDAAVRLLSGTP